MCTPSIIMFTPSWTARLMTRSTPVDTAAVCSRKPTMTGFAPRGTGTLSALHASNVLSCSAGSRSREKMPRMTSRTASVDVMRVMPRRCAISVAMVDFPTPVVPPIMMMSGLSILPSSSRRV